MKGFSILQTVQEKGDLSITSKEKRYFKAIRHLPFQRVYLIRVRWTPWRVRAYIMEYKRLDKYIANY
jgi:hypothetical protein